MSIVSIVSGHFMVTSSHECCTGCDVCETKVKRQKETVSKMAVQVQDSFILFKVKNHYNLQPVAFTLPGTFQENHLATSRKAEILHKALDKDEETWETCVEMETPREFTGAFTIHMSRSSCKRPRPIWPRRCVRSKHCSKY